MVHTVSVFAHCCWCGTSLMDTGHLTKCTVLQIFSLERTMYSIPTLEGQWETLRLSRQWHDGKTDTGFQLFTLLFECRFSSTNCLLNDASLDVTISCQQRSRVWVLNWQRCYSKLSMQPWHQFGWFTCLSSEHLRSAYVPENELDLSGFASTTLTTLSVN